MWAMLPMRSLFPSSISASTCSACICADGIILSAISFTSVSANGDYPTRLSVYLGQEFDGDTMLPIRRIVGLGSQYRGRKIDYVMVGLASQGGQGEAQLFTNGSPESYSQI